MIRSESINDLLGALVAFQAEMPVVPKRTDNPFFKSKYADLAEIKKIAQPLLSKHGLSVVSLPESDEEGKASLTLILFHTSGQFIGSSRTLYLVKPDPQSFGSAVTYARRYGFTAILDIVTEGEDDDGEAATHAAEPRKGATPRTSTTRNSVPEGVGTRTGLANEKQIKLVAYLCSKVGLDEREDRHDYIRGIIKREFASSKELTYSEVDKVIKALKADEAKAEHDPEDADGVPWADSPESF